MEPTAQELTKDKIRLEIAEDKAREYVNEAIQHAVKNGMLAPKDAKEMSFEDKLTYLDWNEWKANS